MKEKFNYKTTWHYRLYKVILWINISIIIITFFIGIFSSFKQFWNIITHIFPKKIVEIQNNENINYVDNFVYEYWLDNYRNKKDEKSSLNLFQNQQSVAGIDPTQIKLQNDISINTNDIRPFWLKENPTIPWLNNQQVYNVIEKAYKDWFIKDDMDELEKKSILDQIFNTVVVWKKFNEYKQQRENMLIFFYKEKYITNLEQEKRKLALTNFIREEIAKSWWDYSKKTDQQLIDEYNNTKDAKWKQDLKNYLLNWNITLYELVNPKLNQATEQVKNINKTIEEELKERNKLSTLGKISQSLDMYTYSWFLEDSKTIFKNFLMLFISFLTIITIKSIYRAFIYIKYNQ